MRILLGSTYDYPQYYDIAFQSYTSMEADFIAAACRKYCHSDAPQLLEPACGTGRLITELARRGYRMIGFDLNRSALAYLRRRLRRRGLFAQTFEADMTHFHLKSPIDVAYCTINTFRDLLTERNARSHLECIARNLRSGGIYILALRLLSEQPPPQKVRRWTEHRGNTRVAVTLRVKGLDLRRRLENLRICYRVRRGSSEFRLQHDFRYRTYTMPQFQRLLDSVASLQLADIYDFQHDIAQPCSLKEKAGYLLFILRRTAGRKASRPERSLDRGQMTAAASLHVYNQHRTTGAETRHAAAKTKTRPTAATSAAAQAYLNEIS